MIAAAKKGGNVEQQEGDDLERRAARAEMMVALGELSSARQALWEGERRWRQARATLCSN